MDLGRDLAERRRSLRQICTEQIVVFDGAMGTMLHSAGIRLDRSLAELNVDQPLLVRDLHTAYLAAGARIVQTNTFDASRPRLARYGLADRVAEVNVAGARLAREAVTAAVGADPTATQALVAGSIGPASGEAQAGPQRSAWAEQIAALADWVDLLVLETFGDLDSLVVAIETAGQESDLPVIAQLSFGEDGRTLRGESPEEVAAALPAPNVAVIGANCTVGPADLRDVVAALAAASPLPISVQPNAGLPQRAGRQFRYARNTRYFGQSARQFVAGGATVLGGCCGTTPAHIAAIAAAVRDLHPTRSDPEPVGHQRTSVSMVARPAPYPTRTGDSPAGAPWPAPGDFVVVAALPAPQRPGVEDFVAQARELRAAGADLLAIADLSTPRARINPVAAGVVLQERVATEVLLPVETADRSLAALQADLLGAHALGLRMIVCRTGAPESAGAYPDPAALWDVDSTGLLAALRNLNEGVDWRGVAAADRTEFILGAGLRTWAGDRQRELSRAEAKVRAGAHFLVTDAIYDAEQAAEVLAELRGRGVHTPVIAALAPFDALRTVERLRHEMPEVSIGSATLAAVRRASAHPDHAAEVALATVDRLRASICGVLVHVPAGWTAHAADLVKQLGARS